MTQKFDRYIYIGDTHGTYLLEEFIKKENDGKTFFYFLGDLFDRGNNSYKNYKLIKKLYKEGLCKIVLGNHDLFFLYGPGCKVSSKLHKQLQKNITDTNKDKLEDLKNVCSSLLYYNGGEETINSIKLGTTKSSPYDKIIKEMTNFLWQNADIFLIDHNNNLLVHGGLPIIKNNDKDTILLSKEIDGNVYEGLDLLKKYNEGFKNGNIELSLDLIYPDTMKVKKELEKRNVIINSNYLDTQFISPVWFDNSKYEYSGPNSNSIQPTLISELNKHNLNNIIVGHWHNKEIFNDKYIDYAVNNRVFRIDKSYIYTTKTIPMFDIYNYYEHSYMKSTNTYVIAIGYCILDNNNNMITMDFYHDEISSE